MPLPSNVGTGTVTGNYSEDNIAGVDLTTWSVTLRPSQRQFADVTATPPTISFLKESYSDNLDSSGNLSLVVPATNDTSLNPLDFTYQVIYTFPGLGLSIPAFYIEVPEGGTVNLPAVNPVAQSNGALIIEGIPTGGTTGQILAKASNTSYDTQWIPAPTGGGGGGTWGSITGSLSAQTDLNTALNGKAATSHTHTAANVTDFSEAVDDRVNGLLAAGTNVSLVYNDTANTLTINASGGGGGSTAWADITGKPTTFDPTIGTTSTTAKAGDYAPTWTEVTSKPAVIAAGADAATARSAIGAGTSNLAIGTTGSTAMAGNKTAADLGGLVSNPTGITGATAFANIVKISDTDYAALPTKDPATLYVRTAG